MITSLAKAFDVQEAYAKRGKRGLAPAVHRYFVGRLIAMHTSQPAAADLAKETGLPFNPTSESVTLSHFDRVFKRASKRKVERPTIKIPSTVDELKNWIETYGPIHVRS